MTGFMTHRGMIT